MKLLKRLPLATTVSGLWMLKCGQILSFLRYTCMYLDTGEVIEVNKACRAYTYIYKAPRICQPDQNHQNFKGYSGYLWTCTVFFWILLQLIPVCLVSYHCTALLSLPSFLFSICRNFFLNLFVQSLVQQLHLSNVFQCECTMADGFCVWNSGWCDTLVMLCLTNDRYDLLRRRKKNHYNSLTILTSYWPCVVALPKLYSFFFLLNLDRWGEFFISKLRAQGVVYLVAL